MKKLLFTLVLAVGAFTFATAQQVEMDTPETATKKACCKKGSKACAKTSAAAATTAAAAAKLAAMDESIESKTCAKSGKVSYYRNATCPASGKTTSTAVQFDNATRTFVNVAPSEAEAVAKKVSLETPAKKSCSKKCSKTCSKGKTASAATTTEEAPKVKLVSSGK